MFARTPGPMVEDLHHSSSFAFRRVTSDIHVQLTPTVSRPGPTRSGSLEKGLDNRRTSNRKSHNLHCSPLPGLSILAKEQPLPIAAHRVKSQAFGPFWKVFYSSNSAQAIDTCVDRYIRNRYRVLVKDQEF